MNPADKRKLDDILRLQDAKTLDKSIQVYHSLTKKGTKVLLQYPRTRDNMLSRG